MKDTPILMSAPMVRGLVDGRKTQTRRVVTPQPELSDRGGFVFTDRNGKRWMCGLGADEAETRRNFLHRCPYGKPGDLLWVKEPFYAFGRWETRYSATKGRDEWHFIDLTQECGKSYRYAASMAGDNGPRARYAGVAPVWWKRPALFMPKAASRLTLRITNVRVERLQEISEIDAAAEGLARISKDGRVTWKYGIPDRDGMPGIDDYGWPWVEWNTDPRIAYRHLWNNINGSDSWDANHWVWAISFEVLQKNVDDALKGTHERPEAGSQRADHRAGQGLRRFVHVDLSDG